MYTRTWYILHTYLRISLKYQYYLIKLNNLDSSHVFSCVVVNDVGTPSTLSIIGIMANAMANANMANVTYALLSVSSLSPPFFLSL